MTKAQREKLEELASYILPVFTFPDPLGVFGGERKMVPLVNADYLRELAREILALERKK